MEDLKRLDESKVVKLSTYTSLALKESRNVCYTPFSDLLITLNNNNLLSIKDRFKRTFHFIKNSTITATK